MPNIQITVRDKIAHVQGSPVIVCGNSDYTVTFDLDNEFAEYNEKTLRVVFRDKGITKHYDVLFTGQMVALPPVYCVNQIAVGLCAGDVISTTFVIIPCHYGDVSQHADPPADVYDQLLSYLAALQNGSNAAVTAVPLANLADGGTVVTTEGEE